MGPPDFKGKKVLVLGLGLHGGGVGVVKFLVKERAIVTVTDLKTRRELAPSLSGLIQYKGICYVLGRHRMEDAAHADFIIKNPGVPWDSSILAHARRNKIPVLTDIGIFFLKCPAPIIGITGTKGKSTTAALIAEVLKRRFVKTKKIFLAGNIRISVLPLLKKISPNDLVVLELSSFQLDDLPSIQKSPHIAVITNIFPDHLNRYPNFRAYKKSKLNIFRYQTENDFLIINKNDPQLAKITHAPGEIFKIGERKGSPYPFASAAAYKIARIYNTKKRIALSLIGHFRGLEGRLEKVRNINGILFINDTTATNPTASIYALRHVKPREGMVMIAGGSDKSMDFSSLAREISRKVKILILLPGDASEKLKKDILRVRLSKTIITEVGSMRDAVRTAFLKSKSGDIVLLSPGAASFGLFRHEFDRGEKFVQEVLKLR